MRMSEYINIIVILNRYSKYVNMFSFSYAATPTDDTQDDLIEMAGDGSEDDLNDDDDDGIYLSGVTSLQPLWVLPLYSLLSTQKQAKVRVFYSENIIPLFNLLLVIEFRVPI